MKSKAPKTPYWRIVCSTCGWSWGQRAQRMKFLRSMQCPKCGKKINELDDDLERVRN